MLPHPFTSNITRINWHLGPNFQLPNISWGSTAGLNRLRFGAGSDIGRGLVGSQRTNGPTVFVVWEDPPKLEPKIFSRKFQKQFFTSNTRKVYKTIHTYSYTVHIIKIVHIEQILDKSGTNNTGHRALQGHLIKMDLHLLLAIGQNLPGRSNIFKQKGCTTTARWGCCKASPPFSLLSQTSPVIPDATTGLNLWKNIRILTLW